MNGNGYYKRYYNGDARLKAKPGYTTNWVVKEYMRDRRPEKQIEYHKSILKFLKDHNVDTSLFERPRNSYDCKQKINAMFTTIRKNGLYEEYMRGRGMDA